MSYPERKKPHWSETADRQPDDTLDVPVTVSRDKESVTMKGGGFICIMTPAQARRLGLALEQAAEELDPTPIPESAPQRVDGAEP